MTDHQDPPSASTDKQDSPMAGAAAQRPPMTPEEMIDRVKKAAGRFTPLRELRQQLPTARRDQGSLNVGPTRRVERESSHAAPARPRPAATSRR